MQVDPVSRVWLVLLLSVPMDSLRILVGCVVLVPTMVG
jgi:hypothetical protein